MNLNSPLKINNQLTLRNRVVVPPMASGTAMETGAVTPQTLAHYKRLATSKASLVMVEYTFVHKSGRSEANQLGIDSNDKILGLAMLAEQIRQAGATSAIQLTHSGAKSSRDLTGGRLISPSGMRVPVKNQELELPDEASYSDISQLKESFVQAARRAYQAGFQIVELHSAHGYGLNQWLSPITNQRQDQYGGPIENRVRLLIEIIKLIRVKVPDILLSVRIPGSDHFPKGLSYEETTKISLLLEEVGVSFINVSSGIGGWRRPRTRVGEGYLVDDAEIISPMVKIPVIGVGGIKTADYINDSLQKNRFSLAAVGRSILEDPQWGPRVGLK